VLALWEGARFKSDRENWDCTRDPDGDGAIHGNHMASRSAGES
jgi:hypothetical protein